MINLNKVNKAVTKAIEIDEFNNNLPGLEIGAKTTLGNVWDGEGEAPADSYSYKLTDNDYINYEFKVMKENEDVLETVIKITSIDLV